MVACSALTSMNFGAMSTGLTPTAINGRLPRKDHRQGIFRLSCTTLLHLCGCTSSNSIAGGVRRGYDRAELSTRCQSLPVPLPRGLAGVQAETSDEVAGVDEGTKPGIKIGQVAIQGVREEMEDVGEVLDGPLGFTYAAVFDGHAGFAAAEFLRGELYKDCVESLDGGTLLKSGDEVAVQEALAHAFQQTDNRLLSWLESQKESDSGSTATIVFMSNDFAIIGHVGDSRAVLSRSGKAVDLSADHRPYGNNKTSIQEISRVKNAGGWISHGRLCGSLSVSRAFGDPGFKTRKKEMMEEGLKTRRWTKPFIEKLNMDGIWLSVTPDVTQVQLDEDAEFIILATDGLWDSFKSRDAVNFVRKQLKDHGNVQLAAEAIAQATLDRNGQDNITVIILDLGKGIKGDDPGSILKWF